MVSKSRFPVETLSSSLKTRFRNATVALDRPRKPTGKWFLDVALEGHSVAVQWKEDKGFGISSSTENAYGEGVDEVYMDEEAAFGRIVSLLLSRSFTSPPLAVTLRELRKEQGLSQTEMGEVLHKQQGEISKIEGRNDMLVSTLAEYVLAVQGELHIVVRFPDGRIRKVQLDDLRK